MSRIVITCHQIPLSSNPNKRQIPLLTIKYDDKARLRGLKGIAGGNQLRHQMNFPLQFLREEKVVDQSKINDGKRCTDVEELGSIKTDILVSNRPPCAHTQIRHMPYTNHPTMGQN